ncbi:MAK10-like protein [Tanacetum coccineum]
MTSQDARLSKFESNFKQQQSEMTNKIDTFLKAINDRMMGALPSDTVKNPKLNVNPTYSVSSTRSHPIKDPQSSSNPFNSVNAIKTLKFRLLEEIENVQGLADGTKLYPVGIIRDVEVYVGKLKLLKDFYVRDIEKDHTCLLLVGRGFLATASAVIDCKKSKIAVGEGITRSIFGVREVGQS